MVPSYRAWLILVVLLVALVITFQWLSPKDTTWKKKAIESPEMQVKDDFPPASLDPGRVIVIDTNKGAVEFVLFEKDCPKTTHMIARLARQGRYNGVKFIRAEKDSLIKTSTCTKDIAPVPSEFKKGLLHEKGSVGLAKWKSSREKSGAIYLLMEPMHHLDYDYTVFGRIINGMDVVKKIRVGDVIKQATVRPLTDLDRKRLSRVLVIEAERRTE